MNQDETAILQLRPATLFDFVFQGGFSSPEEANQVDIIQSRQLFHDAVAEAVRAREVEIEITEFMPDELAESGKAGAVAVFYDLVAADLASGDSISRQILAQATVEVLKGIFSSLRRRLSEAQVRLDNGSAPRVVDGQIIQDICLDHASEVHAELRPSRALRLRPVGPESVTSLQDRVYTVVVGCESGELIYVIDDQLRPQSLIRATGNEYRLLETVTLSIWYELPRE